MIKYSQCLAQLSSQRQQVDLNSEYPQPKHIILDCDTGGDDAQAILVALHLAKKYNKKIVAIMCVQGNTGIDNVIKNVLVCKSVLVENDQALKNDFPPIFKGASYRLLGDSIYGTGKDDYFHTDGLCSNQQKYIQIAAQNNIINIQKEFQQICQQQQTAFEAYIRLSKEHENDIGIMAIGPLTNLALAYKFDIQIVNRISCVSIMGGQYEGIGMGEYFAADFNFHLDADAAKLTLQVYPNIVCVSLQYAFLYDTIKAKQIFENKSTRKAELVADIYAPIKAFMTPVLCDPLTCFPIFCAQKTQIKGIYLSGVVQTFGKRTRGFFASKLEQKNNSANKKIFFVTHMNSEFLENEVIESYGKKVNNQ